MKIEKKQIALCIFALTIGIATLLPLSYFTPRIGATAQTLQVFNPDLYSIVVLPDSTTLLSEYGVEAVIDINAAYAVNNTNFKDVDAKIEVYNYHIYSDQGSIANITHSIAITTDVSDPRSPSGYTSAIADRSREKNSYTFADGTILDLTEAIGYVEGSIMGGILMGPPDTWDTLVSTHSATFISASNGEKSVQAIDALRSAQTIYVDVTVVLSVTYKHPNNSEGSSIIATTSANRNVLFHVELTKMDDGSFRYGSNMSDDLENIVAFTVNNRNLPANNNSGVFSISPW